MRGLVVLLTLVVAVAVVPLQSQRIVGGSASTINQYPEIVALLFSWGTTNHGQACAGTILNNRSILTAAHCTIGDAPARWLLRVGSAYANSGGQLLSSAQIFNHPQYNRWNLDNDVSIIHTASNIGFSGSVWPGRIATANYNLDDNQVVWAAGWGFTSTVLGASASEQLRHVQIWTVNLQTCRQRYATIGLQVTDNILCSGWLDVGDRDQCQGDSSGPIYHKGVVVGVCSWGEGCALARFPGVSTRVSRYTNWISSNL